jgi:signal transduction histidine kinase
MLAYSARILQLSLVISLITAVLVFFSLRWLLVRPMARLTRAMTLFREKPEEAGRVIRPSGRRDEVGVAETELAAMQTALRSALHQRARLAALGEAVAKINHDLRNILATAQLLSDRLSQSDDPEVRHVTPTLFVAIDRAVGLASRVVEFARTGAPSLRRSSIALAELVADAGTALPNGRGIGSWINRVPAGLTVMGDREELLRVLNNLARNAFDSGARRVEVGARARDGWTSLTVTDDGPGIPEDVRQSLFQPFATSSKAGSSGLGLAIAREVMHAHGGEIQLVQTGPRGTTFRLDLPSRDLR